jgi:ribonuclease HI
MKKADLPPDHIIEDLKELARMTGIYFVDVHKPHVCIWADGSGFGKGEQPCGYAAVLQMKGKRREISESAPKGTNQFAELSAIHLGLKTLTRPVQVRVFSDSQYAIQVCRDWMHTWAGRGWRRSKTLKAIENNQQIQNLEIIQKIHSLAEVHQIEWNWVKGHSGNTENERCDKLANIARESHKPEPKPPSFF